MVKITLQVHDHVRMTLIFVISPNGSGVRVIMNHADVYTLTILLTLHAILVIASDLTHSDINNMGFPLL
jgi:hypothetical protein